ncbi:MAG TPA: hypothetical protein RMH99_03500 [Sandaracinaceae bacterium LLY-WYZ-13_1]|nr:hypothetical protein [Sandaracinaceae bacterium LLY-WYZ-13_1]
MTGTRAATLAATMTALALAAGCNASHGRDDDAGAPADAGVVTDDAATGCTLPEPEAHRSAEATCRRERPAPPLAGEIPEHSECDEHADCTEGTNGRCTGGSFHGYHCSYDRCFADDDCADRGGPCLCRGDGGGVASGGANRCAAGNCRTDADCGPGGFCSPSLGDCGDYGGVQGYYCHTCEDECTDDADCADMEGIFGRGYCAYDEVVGHWRCAYDHCAG